MALQDSPSIDQRIAAYVAARPVQVFSSQELGEAVHETDTKRVGMALARLQRWGKITKHPEGGFTATRVEHKKPA